VGELVVCPECTGRWVASGLLAGCCTRPAHPSRVLPPRRPRGRGSVAARLRPAWRAEP